MLKSNMLSMHEAKDGKFDCMISDPVYGYDDDRGEHGLLGFKYYPVVVSKKIENNEVLVIVHENKEKVCESIIRCALPWNSVKFVDEF